MASQIRVVLNPELKPLADEIKQVTGCGSTSEVISLLLSRYGKHFIAWWLSNPHQLELSAIASLQDFPIQQTDVVDLSTPIEL
jgi:hypothetical protein